MTGLQQALADAVRQPGPDTIALMRVLVEAATEQEGRTALAQAIAAAADDAAAKARLRRLQALWAAHPRAWQVVRGTIGGIAHAAPRGSSSDAVAYWADAFDRLVAAQPEASVALYSLGSPELLADATREVVDHMTDWGVLPPHAHVLDLGCGIGRFLTALAPRVTRVIGRDVSSGMVAEAQRRCAGLGNVSVGLTAGRDLAGIADASLDLVLAADVFPYLVEAGQDLVRSHVADAARVLRSGGALLVLNWSYRGDLEADRRAAATLAATHDFELECSGASAFALWDAAVFLFRKAVTKRTGAAGN